MVVPEEFCSWMILEGNMYFVICKRAKGLRFEPSSSFFFYIYPLVFIML